MGGREGGGWEVEMKGVGSAAAAGGWEAGGEVVGGRWEWVW